VSTSANSGNPARNSRRTRSAGLSCLGSAIVFIFGDRGESAPCTLAGQQKKIPTITAKVRAGKSTDPCGGLPRSHYDNGTRIAEAPKYTSRMTFVRWLMRDSRRTIRQMNSATQPITVIFACPRCGTVYRASQYRGVGTQFGIFNCLACHTQVYAWNGAYDFSDWKVGVLAPGNPAKHGRPPNKKSTRKSRPA
jgi:predicted RNA-binding Zn-ribbon protein involved in translation (DUF1610 family)